MSTSIPFNQTEALAADVPTANADLNVEPGQQPRSRTFKRSRSGMCMHDDHALLYVVNWLRRLLHLSRAQKEV